MGFSIVDLPESAQFVIVNTCSVTSLAETKTGRFLRALSRTAPNARILVTGCFAQQHGSALLEYPGVNWVIGNAHKHRIPSILTESAKEKKLCFTDVDLADETSVFWEDCLYGPETSGRTRFSLKIQEGCDFGCSYCIVPALRGRSRSASKLKLVDIFKRSLDMGYKEIVLTGTHIGQYRDSRDGGGLEELLTRFLKEKGDYRIRLSSLDPRDLTDTIISMAGREKRICDHLHVSVQSLCADVLRSMKRPHEHLETLLERLRSFRQKYPSAGLGADFIVGHPGESGAMFETTLRNAESVGFTYGHVFRFSKRLGTESSLKGDQITESVKKARSAALRDLLQNSRNIFLYSQLSIPLRIIIEDTEPARGVSGNYIKVEVRGMPKGKAQKNRWVTARLNGEAARGYQIAVGLCQNS
jgi:threonylcarbamoyladenosine tRNA methylthiotransferase MtaB